MTDDDRGALLDLAVLGVASVAVYLVLRNPPLRRAAWRFLKYAALTAAPRLALQETTRAWAESAPPAPAPALNTRD